MANETILILFDLLVISKAWRPHSDAAAVYSKAMSPLTLISQANKTKFRNFNISSTTTD